MVAIPHEGILILSIILILIGAILLWAPLPPFAAVNLIGNLLLWAGVIIFVVWLILTIIALVKAA